MYRNWFLWLIHDSFAASATDLFIYLFIFLGGGNFFLTFHTADETPQKV